VVSYIFYFAIVYHLLQNNRLRLSELQNKLPDINQCMLIRQLRELEQDKILERPVYPVVLPKVDYKLTRIGLKLDKVVFSICDWEDHFLDPVNN
ncbi:transcriptional regulator, partial [Staphylococcus sp. KY49P]|nr:transcriptional regulator [Staphylococcus sp. KY49P]